MADVRISALPQAQAITGTELVPVVQGGLTVQTTVSAITQSPSQTQPFLTVSQQPTLPNSRYLSAINGIQITDGGAQNPLTLSLVTNPTIPGTAGMAIPSGTTAQRNTTPAAIRFNTQTLAFEGFDGTNWVSFIVNVAPQLITFSAGTTGLTPSIPTGGNVVLAGTLNIANGGTGATTAAAARTALGLGTIATQNANAVAITGGSIDGATIGATTVAAGSFSTLNSSGDTRLGGLLGNQSLQVNNVASATDYVQVTGSLASGSPLFGQGPVIQATGPETTISLNLVSKGTNGSVNLKPNGASTLVVGQSGSGIGNYISIYPTASTMNWVLAGTDTNIGYTLNTKGTGAFYFVTGGGQQAFITDTVSAVNYLGLTGAATGGAPTVLATGSDTDVGLTFAMKGWNSIKFNSTTGGQLFQVGQLTGTTSNYLQALGNSTGNAPVFSAQGTDTNVGLVLSSKGTGVVALGGTTVANSAAQFVPTTSSVNYIQFQGGATGISPSFVSTGTDAAVGFFLSTKGNANVNFGTNSFGNFSFIIKNVASAVNYLVTTGAATGNAPDLSAQGSDANIGLTLSPKGTGFIRVINQLIVGRNYTGNESIGIGGSTGFAASTGASGVYNDITIDSTKTVAYTPFNTYISTQAASFNVGVVTHYKASFFTLGSGSSITTQYGFFADGSLTSASNNYGFYSVINAAANRYNFYAAGTAANVFVGNTTLGGTVGTQSLQVNNVASAVNYVQVIGAVTTGAPELSAQGSDTNIGLTFLTKNSGGIGIGNAAAAGRTLDISKNITGAISGYGINQRGQVQTDVTADAASYRSVSNTIIGSTLPTYNHFFAVQGTLSGTVSNQFGFVAESSLTGATNNYGFYGNIAAATGRYNFYANGTAINVFVGNTTIGGTVGTQSLQVNNVASAVNYVQAIGATTTNPPEISAQGSDTNISLNLTPKGTGSVTINATTAITVPAGTTAQRPTGATGMFRYNSTTAGFEGYNGTVWGAIGGGSNITTLGLYENANTISANYTIGTSNNAVSAGPITINAGVVVTVPSGSTWVVI
jgi:hypothetical protein